MTGDGLVVSRAVGWIAASLAAVGTLLTAQSDATARQYRMSGTWEIRRGGHGIFLPLQFGTVMGPSFTQTGTLGRGTPHGPVPGQGAVTATGSAPASLALPAGRFGGSFTAIVPLRGSSQVQLTTGLDFAGPEGPAHLAPGLGPGSFTWCPGDPGCTVGSAPLELAGTRGQRVAYRAGPHQFGGVMQMLLQGRGVSSFVFRFASPVQIGHAYFASDPGLAPTGGTYASTHVSYQKRGVVTQPLVPPTVDDIVQYPGPKVTTQGGLTTTGTGEILYLPGVITTPMGFQAGVFTSRTGFPWTTGTVLVQQTGYSDTLWTLMGSDMRTALGGGNITLVAGGLALRHATYGSAAHASFGRIRMSFASPVPSMTPGGLAAAGALLLLAVAHALGRRRAAKPTVRRDTRA